MMKNNQSTKRAPKKHEHKHTHPESSNIGLAFFLNLGFSVIELVGGLFTNSVAIISDAVHDFGDSISLATAWYLQKLSKKGRGAKYSYGYRRFSLLGATINSVILIVGSIYILSEAIPRLASPEETSAEGMFILAIIGIVVNGFAVLKTYKASSMNERVVSLHMLEDVLGWAAVLVGSIIMYFTGLTIIDPILSIGVACFILFNAGKSAKQALHILLQGSPDISRQDQIAAAIKKVKNVQKIHDLHIWSLDEDYEVLTVHAVLEKPITTTSLATTKTAIRDLLDKKGIRHSTIELESANENCPLENC